MPQLKIAAELEIKLLDISSCHKRLALISCSGEILELAGLKST